MHGALEIDLQYQLPDKGVGKRQALTDKHLGHNENQLVQVVNDMLKQHSTQTFLDALLLEYTLHSDKKAMRASICCVRYVCRCSRYALQTGGNLDRIRCRLQRFDHKCRLKKRKCTVKRTLKIKHEKTRPSWAS